MPLARRFGAALVVGLIDETGDGGHRRAQARGRAAQPPHPDRGDGRAAGGPLVRRRWSSPAAPATRPTSARRRRRSRACAAIKAELPLAKTVLGISNVSFGLPPAGREVLNSVFLYHCDAGRPRRRDRQHRAARPLRRDPRRGAAARRGADLPPLGDKAAGEAAVAAFTAHFRGRKAEGGGQPDRAALPLAERLARAIVEGTKDGLEEDLADRARRASVADPLEIVNGPLMAGMAEVGRLFNANQLIVAEVLQSAEVMKAAVSYLEPHMEKPAARSSRGKVLLATVKGDVHDIGKNLVDIVLSNNGFEVVNLGIKVPSEELIQAVAQHRPDVIGLSGLLVKSAQQMVATAADLRARGASPRRCWSAARRSPGASPTSKIAAGLRRALHLRQGRHARPGAGRAAARPGARPTSSSARSRAPLEQDGAVRPDGRRGRSPARRAATRPRSGAICRLRRRPTSSATSRPSTSTPSGPSSTRRCSSASTSACAARSAELAEEGDEKFAKLEARRRRAQGGRAPRSDDGAGGLALLPGPRRGREIDPPRSGERQGRGRVGVPAPVAAPRGSASPTTCSTATTWRSSSPPPAPACASSSRSGSAPAST